MMMAAKYREMADYDDKKLRFVREVSPAEKENIDAFLCSNRFEAGPYASEGSECEAGVETTKGELAIDTSASGITDGIAGSDRYLGNRTEGNA